MALYDFIDENGEAVVLEIPMRDAPSMGESIQHEGRTLTRPFQAPKVFVEKDVTGPSVQHRPWAPGFTDYAKDGSPIPRNRREQREGAKRAGTEIID